MVLLRSKFKICTSDIKLSSLMHKHLTHIRSADFESFQELRWCKEMLSLFSVE
jgi:hypothetical protein